MTELSKNRRCFFPEHTGKETAPLTFKVTKERSFKLYEEHEVLVPFSSRLISFVGELITDVEGNGSLTIGSFSKIFFREELGSDLFDVTVSLASLA